MATKKKPTKSTKKAVEGVNPDAPPHNVELQDADGKVLKTSTMPAFYNFPGVIDHKGKLFKFWGHEGREGKSVLLYRLTVAHVVK